MYGDDTVVWGDEVGRAGVDEDAFVEDGPSTGDWSSSSEKMYSCESCLDLGRRFVGTNGAGVGVGVGTAGRVSTDGADEGCAVGTVGGALRSVRVRNAVGE